MGFFSWLWSMINAPSSGPGAGYRRRKRQSEPPADQGMGLDEVARRTGLDAGLLSNIEIAYTRFTLAKPGGGQRVIDKPSAELARVQRVILRRLLGRLRAHPAACGFERGKSIVHNALPHANKDTVVRFDIRGFFNNTRRQRVYLYFRRIGYNAEAANALTRICTLNDGLPQGAPTSPRLANLVNYGLDVRLATFAESANADYTRYADDITFSYTHARFTAAGRNPVTSERVHYSRKHVAVSEVYRAVGYVLRDYGYKLNRAKTRVYHRHHRQQVVGLVVNDGVRLPRKVRRRLRAIQHHLETGRDATLTWEQLAGWRSLQAMIAQQTVDAMGDGG